MRRKSTWKQKFLCFICFIVGAFLSFFVLKFIPANYQQFKFLIFFGVLIVAGGVPALLIGRFMKN